MYVIVVGCGRVGSRLAYRLQAEGHDLAVVDHDPQSLHRLGRGFRGEALVGSALDESVLLAAGIDRADALATVTGSDEINAVLARLGVKRFRVPRVVARIYDPGEAELYSRLGVMTISPVEWGISRLAHLLTLRQVAHTTSLGAGRVHILEAEISPNLAGRKAQDLEIAGETRVISVLRTGRTILADPATRLEAGDVVALAVVAGSEDHVQELLQ